MSVATKHPDYEDACHDWMIMRDLHAGERVMKERGETYIRKLTNQKHEDYEQYIDRSSFFNATARTAEGMHGYIFLKEPLVTFGAEEGDPRAPERKVFLNDADLSGSTFYGYSKAIADEVILMGRCGTLVDWSEEENRAYVVKYDAEDIFNWRVERVRGRMLPVLITLREFTTKAAQSDGYKGAVRKDEYDTSLVEQMRVLKLVPDGGDWAYEVEVYQLQEDDKEHKPTRDRKRKDGEKGKRSWLKVESYQPTKKGDRLREIPFVFHGPDECGVKVQKIPLIDLAYKNLDHFRLSTQLRHGVYYTALPTPVVMGELEGNEYYIGSKVAWNLPMGGDAKFLEFQGGGLSTLMDVIEVTEKQMAVIGARLLETQKRQVEATDTHEMRQAGETSVLRSIAGTVSEGLTKVLKWVYWWQGSADDMSKIDLDTVSYELNDDFISRRLSGRDALDLVAVWQASGMSKESLFDNLKDGELIRADRSFEDEESLIEAGKEAMMKFQQQMIGNTGDDDDDEEEEENGDGGKKPEDEEESDDED